MRAALFLVCVFIGCGQTSSLNNPSPQAVAATAEVTPVERIDADLLLAHYRVNIINAVRQALGSYASRRLGPP